MGAFKPGTRGSVSIEYEWDSGGGDDSFGLVACCEGGVGLAKEYGGEVTREVVLVRRRVTTEAFDEGADDDVVDSCDLRGCGDGERAFVLTSRVTEDEEGGASVVLARFNVTCDGDARTDGSRARFNGTVSNFGRRRDFTPLATASDETPARPSLRSRRLGLSSESLPIRSPFSKSSSSSACLDRGIDADLDVVEVVGWVLMKPFFLESRIRTRSLGRKDSGNTRPSTSFASRSSSPSSSVVKSVLGEALRVAWPGRPSDSKNSDVALVAVVVVASDAHSESVLSVALEA